MACVPSEGSDSAWASAQSDQSLRCALNGQLSITLSSCGQRRLWSDWADAQADLSLRWAHMPLCWFCHEEAYIVLCIFCTTEIQVTRQTHDKKVWIRVVKHVTQMTIMISSSSRNVSNEKFVAWKIIVNQIKALEFCMQFMGKYLLGLNSFWPVYIVVPLYNDTVYNSKSLYN